MNKTPIEWCDYTINPVKGLCPMACSYCYARRMYKRFKWDESIYYNNDVWNGLIELDHKPRQRIFVGSTIELFGDWVKEEWLDQIFRWVRGTPEHTFIFLTKQPQNLIKFSPFPDTCRVGVSATDRHMAHNAFKYLHDIKASVKFISFEPLLSWGNDPVSLQQSIYGGLTYAGIKWVIIGCQTKPTIYPKIEWVREIVEACDKAGIKVFLKNNLMPLIIDQPMIPAWSSDKKGLRQEIP